MVSLFKTDGKNRVLERLIQCSSQYYNLYSKYIYTL